MPICNTMYKIVNGTIPREVCTNVPQTYCNKETKVVEDKTCQTETKIECTSSPSSSFEKSVSYKSGSSSGGYDDQDVKYSSSNGRSSVGHSSCHKKLETKCFTTPREVTMVNCFTKLFYFFSWRWGSRKTYPEEVERVSITSWCSKMYLI